MQRGSSLSGNAPAERRAWVESGQPTPLRSQSAITYRTKSSFPDTPEEMRMLEAAYLRFPDDPYEFEDGT